jgi:gamma-glutamyltranspeptidase/glutathione hydrolase
MVATADDLATAAGVGVLARGGNAVDAALAASAVLAVTVPHMSGMGGDLIAVVHRRGEQPRVLFACGRVGSGADAAALRAEGHRVVPLQDDPRAISIPGCVDGWVELCERFGTMPLAELLGPAQRYARNGFAITPKLAAFATMLDGADGAGVFTPPLVPGSRLRPAGLADALGAVMADGRDGFYSGPLAAALRTATNGAIEAADLAVSQATWMPALHQRLWGFDIWTAPPPSQGYVALSAGWLAERCEIPADPEDPLFAHLLIEAVRQASWDRSAVLHEDADGLALLAEGRLRPRLDAIDPARASRLPGAYRDGDTTYLCAADSGGLSVSLIQSLGMPWGARIFVDGYDVVLQNRASGCSLAAGHPAHYAPNVRPPHTLSPLLVTDDAGRMRLLLGTMGGDSQPQILVQLLARILAQGASVGEAVEAPRWIISNPAGGAFDTWQNPDNVCVSLETSAPSGWHDALRRRGHLLRDGMAADRFGHAQAIALIDDIFTGAADPRALSGAALGV